MKQVTPQGQLEATKGILRDDVLHVRVKPQNKRLGHVRGRQFVNELDQVFKGGSGKLGDVPVWYEVDPGYREALMRYRQNTDNPASPCVFDICTAQEREEIDRYEETMRLGQAGIGSGHGPNTRGVRAVTESTAPQALPPPPNPPSLAEGAEVFREEPLPRPAPILPQAMAGRAAALAGVQEQPQPVAKRAHRTHDVGNNRGPQDQILDYNQEPIPEGLEEMVQQADEQSKAHLQGQVSTHR